MGQTLKTASGRTYCQKTNRQASLKNGKMGKKTGGNSFICMLVPSEEVWKKMLQSEKKNTKEGLYREMVLEITRKYTFGDSGKNHLKEALQIKEVSHSHYQQTVTA